MLCAAPAWPVSGMAAAGTGGPWGANTYMFPASGYADRWIPATGRGISGALSPVVTASSSLARRAMPARRPGWSLIPAVREAELAAEGRLAELLG